MSICIRGNTLQFTPYPGLTVGFNIGTRTAVQNDLVMPNWDENGKTREGKYIKTL